MKKLNLTPFFIISFVIYYHTHSIDKGEPANKLANLVTSLICIPFHINFDYRVGSNNRFKYAQPVISVSLGENWSKQKVSLGVGPRFPLGSDTSGSFGMRGFITFLFPK